MREEEVTIEKNESQNKTIPMVDTHIIKGMKRTVDGWMDGRMDGWMGIVAVAVEVFLVVVII